MVLGHRIHDHIRPQFKRALAGLGGKDIVDNQDRPGGMGQFGNRGDINEIKQPGLDSVSRKTILAGVFSASRH